MTDEAMLRFWCPGYEPAYFRWVFRFFAPSEVIDNVLWLTRLEADSRKTQDWEI